MNWHTRHKESRTFGDRTADNVASFVGSWSFLFLHSVWFGVWIIFTIEPFPYGLLTMIVSLEAIFLSTFIMISQNRTADRDRHNAEADYQTNIEAKQEIEQLMAVLSRIEEEKLDKIINKLSR